MNYIGGHHVFYAPGQLREVAEDVAMKTSIVDTPMNSIVFLHGGGDWVSPTPFWGGGILAGNSGLIVGCMPEIDGPTEIVLGDTADVDPGKPADFSSVLKVGGGELVISNVEDETLLSMPSPSELVQVQIWRSDPQWPETVVIGIAAPGDPAAAKAALLPNDRATRTSLPLTAETSGLLLCDGSIAEGRPGFDPWAPAAGRSGRVTIPVDAPSDLTIIDALPQHSLGSPEIDAEVATPTRLLRVYPSDQPVLLMVDTETTRTRIRAWTRQAVGRNAIVIVVTAVADAEAA